MAKKNNTAEAVDLKDITIDNTPETIAKSAPVQTITKEVVREVEVEKKSKAPSTSFLTSEKVTVKYIIKQNASIKDPKHVGYGGMFIGTEQAIPAPTLDSQKMKNLLTKEEKEGLEYLLGVNLSVYGPFWKESHKKGGLLPIFLGKDDLVLDKSDPYDYLKIKVLMASPIVANSLDEIRNKATYRFVMVAEGEEILKEKNAVGNKVIAFEKYVEYKNNKSVLRYILRNLGRYTSKTQKLDFLQIETAKMIEKDPNLFVAISSDRFIKTKVLLEECFENGVIDMRDKKYYTKEGQPISEGDTPTLTVASEYLDSALGQEMRLTLEAKLKNTKE